MERCDINISASAGGSSDLARALFEYRPTWKGESDGNEKRRKLVYSGLFNNPGHFLVYVG